MPFFLFARVKEEKNVDDKQKEEGEETNDSCKCRHDDSYDENTHKHPHYHDTHDTLVSL